MRENQKQQNKTNRNRKNFLPFTLPAAMTFKAGRRKMKIKRNGNGKRIDESLATFDNYIYLLLSRR